VARFDRFARSTKHLVLALEEFQALGIDFISLSESIDTSTPMGRMVFRVIGAVAELERSLIRERVVMGLNRAPKGGTRLGRPRVSVDAAEVVRSRAQGCIAGDKIRDMQLVNKQSAVWLAEIVTEAALLSVFWVGFWGRS